MRIHLVALELCSITYVLSRYKHLMELGELEVNDGKYYLNIKL